MRWNNLSLAAPESPGALPLALPGAVARTFDSPGFAGMTFYEIQAKSIISRVPAASRMPFEWTINPYRGCSHACVYCQVGDTPILMADGRTKPLADIRGRRPRLRHDSGRRPPQIRARPPCSAHWSTTKAAYRVRLADGTELTASADHRLPHRPRLEVRPIRSVNGATTADPQPFDRLVGTGQFAEPPKDTADYRAGYLCGLLAGDRPGPSPPIEVAERVRRFRATAI